MGIQLTVVILISLTLYQIFVASKARVVLYQKTRAFLGRQTCNWLQIWFNTKRKASQALKVGAPNWAKDPRVRAKRKQLRV